MDINDVVFIAAMSVFPVGGIVFSFILLPRFLSKDEEKQERKEAEEWVATKATMKAIAEKIRLGPFQLFKIEHGSKAGMAKITWFDGKGGKKNAELPQGKFHIEFRETHNAPTVEFSFNADWLIQNKFWGLWRVGITEESIKKFPLQDWMSGESVLQAMVRVSNIYEPFSLKGISTVSLIGSSNEDTRGEKTERSKSQSRKEGSP